MSAVKLLASLVLAGILAGAAAGAVASDPKKHIKPVVQARAKAISVKRSDLPGNEWKTQPGNSSHDTPRCSFFNPDESSLTENGDFNSPEFTAPNGTYVSSTVGIFVSAQQAKTGYLAVVRPALPKCLAELIAKSGKPGAIKVTAAGPLSFKHYSDRSAAFRVAFGVKSGTVRVPAFIDLVAMNRGAVVTALFFGSVLKAPPSAFEQRIVDRVSARISS
jgi:hypothetical protein